MLSTKYIHMCSCESMFSLQMKVVVSLKLKNINQCLHKLYLEYISIGVHNSMNDYVDPPTKRPRHPLNKYSIGHQRSRQKQQLQNS